MWERSVTSAHQAEYDYAAVTIAAHLARLDNSLQSFACNHFKPVWRSTAGVKHCSILQRIKLLEDRKIRSKFSLNGAATAASLSALSVV